MQSDVKQPMLHDDTLRQNAMNRTLHIKNRETMFTVFKLFETVEPFMVKNVYRHHEFYCFYTSTFLISCIIRR